MVSSRSYRKLPKYTTQMTIPIHFLFCLGYLNEAGKLNLKRFEVFMGEMSEIDRDLFREHYEDLKYMESKYVRLMFP